jgi:hypothetical protein
MIGPNSLQVRQRIRASTRASTPRRIKCLGRNLWLVGLLFITDGKTFTTSCACLVLLNSVYAAFSIQNLRGSFQKPWKLSLL